MVDLLRAEEITVSFGGVRANDGVSLTCPEGSITALIGPNGAGKSVFFDAVSGARHPASGRVHFAGHDMTGRPMHERARLGMARTFQTASVVEEMSVLDNVVLGAARFRRYGFGAAVCGLRRVRACDRRLATIAGRALTVVGLRDAAALPAAMLPYGHRRRLEIARALALGPRLLMLDEPAAGMDSDETAELAGLMRKLRDSWGLTILVVEHDVGFIRSVADYISVLNFGRVLAAGDGPTVLGDPKVVEAYLGVQHA